MRLQSLPAQAVLHQANDPVRRVIHAPDERAAVAAGTAVVAPVQVGAAEPLDIPGQETILLSEHDAAFGAPNLAPGFRWIHVLTLAF